MVNAMPEQPVRIPDSITPDELNDETLDMLDEYGMTPEQACRPLLCQCNKIFPHIVAWAHHCGAEHRGDDVIQVEAYEVNA